jgi:glycosyltransferase involved in cell wall biosynthesis
MVDRTTKRKKILFLAPSMRGGGAERFVTILLRHFNREKFEGSLGLVIKDGPFISDIPKDIEIIDLKASRVRYVLPKLIGLIRKKRPEVVLSTIGHLSVFVMIARPALSKKIYFIARETNIPSINIRQSSFPRLFLILYRWLYPKLDLLICQSQDMKNDLVQHFGIPDESLVVINNPVDVEWINERVRSEEKLFDSGKFNVLAAGKLKYQKGFDLLLRAMASLNDDRYHLTILGAGPEGESLKHLRTELGLTSRVTFLGFVENPYKYMSQADIFVLSSRFEGFPNVMLESMACGTPVVSFDCLGGILEIIQDGINGYVVELGDISALSKAIKRATHAEFNRGEIRSYIENKFDVTKIIPKYEKAFLRFH